MCAATRIWDFFYFISFDFLSTLRPKLYWASWESYLSLLSSLFTVTALLKLLNSFLCILFVACSLVVVLEVRLVKPNGNSETVAYETNGLYV